MFRNIVLSNVKPVTLFGQPVPFALVKSGDRTVGMVKIKGDGHFEIKEGTFNLPQRAKVSRLAKKVAQAVKDNQRPAPTTVEQQMTKVLRDQQKSLAKTLG